MRKKIIKSLILTALVSSTLLCQTTAFAMNSKTNVQTTNVKSKQGNEYQKLESIPEFKKLSSDDQKLVKEILNDKEKMTLALNEFFNGKESTKIDENIEIIKTSKVEDLSSSNGRQKRSLNKSVRVSEQHSVRIKGFTILGVTGYISYDYVEGDRVTRINSSDIILTNNFPSTTISKGKIHSYISGSRSEAIVESTVTVGVGINVPYFDDIGADFPPKMFTVHGDVYGNSWYDWADV